VKTLPISIEVALLFLVAIYIALAIIFGLVRGWNYLKGIPSEEREKEYHWHNERIVLTLAGFSLTALSLFLSIQLKELPQISSILIFFSIAFSTLVLSSLSLRLRVRRFSIYLADVFMNAGLLSIGCGFLAFFAEAVSWYDGSTIIFVILVIALFLASLINQFYFDRYTKYWREGEKKK